MFPDRPLVKHRIRDFVWQPAQLGYLQIMAVSGSKSIDIEAPPAAVLDVIADIDAMPSWSSIHKSADVINRYDDGRPRQVRMSVSLMGISDDQIVEYSWSDNKVTWELVESSQQKSQSAEYRLTETETGTHVDFDMSVDLKIPVPGLLVKRGQKSVLEMATKGLRDQIVG